MSRLERKSIEPIALNVENAKVRAMQHFLSDVVWDEERILSRYHGMVGEDLADAEGVPIFDESGFVKNRYCFLDSRLFGEVVIPYPRLMSS